MSIEPRTVDLPRAMGRTVRIYGNLASFLRHLFKHMLDTQEAAIWARYLPTREGHWKALGRHRYANGVDASLIKDSPEAAEMVNHAYRDVVTFIAAGLQHADAKPVFARLVETWRNPRTGQTRETEYIEALSPEGCVLIVRGPVLRTAYFASTRSTRPYDVYWAGLHTILARVTRVQRCAPWYAEEEGVWRTGRSANLHSPETLTNRSNPWPKPASTAVPLEKDEMEEAIIARYLRR